jgi:hypothetical protein
MKIGYARVSTQDQRLNLQLEALRKAGCKRIFREKVTGAYRERPELNPNARPASRGRHRHRLETRPTGPLHSQPAGNRRNNRCGRRTLPVSIRAMGQYHHSRRQDDHDRLRRYRSAGSTSISPETTSGATPLDSARVDSDLCVSPNVRCGPFSEGTPTRACAHTIARSKAIGSPQE